MYVREHESDFIDTATKHNNMEAKKALEQSRKAFNKATARMIELDTLFRKLYEDNALGRLGDQQFIMLTSGYEDERGTLKKRVSELESEFNAVEERGADVEKFVKIVRQYTDFTELTYENVHEFIERILIHEPDKETNTRKVEIFYSFVNRVDSGNDPIEHTSYLRREGKKVKCIVI